MIVDEQMPRFPQNGQALATGKAGPGQALSPPEYNQIPRRAEDEPALALVPPPVMLTRVFPGL